MQVDPVSTAATSTSMGIGGAISLLPARSISQAGPQPPAALSNPAKRSYRTMMGYPRPPPPMLPPQPQSISSAFAPRFAVPLLSASSSSPQPNHKNAVVALNEIRPGLAYSIVDQRGPVHDPTFVMEVVVNGETFRGEGRYAEGRLRALPNLERACTELIIALITQM